MSRCSMHEGSVWPCTRVRTHARTHAHMARHGTARHGTARHAHIHSNRCTHACTRAHTHPCMHVHTHTCVHPPTHVWQSGVRVGGHKIKCYFEGEVRAIMLTERHTCACVRCIPVPSCAHARMHAHARTHARMARYARHGTHGTVRTARHGTHAHMHARHGTHARAHVHATRECTNTRLHKSTYESTRECSHAHTCAHLHTSLGAR